MSCWATAMVAAKNAVTVPTMAITHRTFSASNSSGLMRTMRYTPAVTIVAAWISADTGVGPSMASGSQMNSGSWADLPTAPRNRSRQMAVAVLERQVLGERQEAGVAERAHRLEGEEHRQHEAEVADAVGDEGLLARHRGAVAVEPERDQEVGAGAHALPAEEGHDEVLAQHEHEHREHEEVQVDEELGELRIAVHVPDRVQVDERADAGDEQRHRDRQRVDQEAHLHVEPARGDPGEEVDHLEPLLARP